MTALDCRAAERATDALEAARSDEPGDLLCDLLHLLGPDAFEDALTSAQMHYHHEVTEPDGFSNECGHVGYEYPDDEEN